VCLCVCGCQAAPTAHAEVGVDKKEHGEEDAFEVTSKRVPLPVLPLEIIVRHMHRSGVGGASSSDGEKVTDSTVVVIEDSDEDDPVIRRRRARTGSGAVIVLEDSDEDEPVLAGSGASSTAPQHAHSSTTRDVGEKRPRDEGEPSMSANVPTREVCVCACTEHMLPSTQTNS